MIDIYFSTDTRRPVDPYALYSAVVHAARAAGSEVHDAAFWIRADVGVVRCGDVAVAGVVAAAMTSVRRLGSQQVTITIDAIVPAGYSSDVEADVVFNRTMIKPTGGVKKCQIVGDEFEAVLGTRVAAIGVDADFIVGPEVHGNFVKDGRVIRWTGYRVRFAGLSRAEWRALVSNPIGARKREGCGVFL